MAFFSFIKKRSDHVLGMNRRNLDYVYTKNPRKHFPLADNKLKTKKTLSDGGIPVAKTLCTFSAFHELNSLERRLKGFEEFVIKPANGSAGRGILVIGESSGDRFRSAGGRIYELYELRRHVADIIFGVYAFDKKDEAIIEERIRPHQFFENMYGDGLADIRIIVLDGNPVLGMIRVPTRQSNGKANLHQGAIGLGVDMNTGLITRGWYKKKSISEHPDSGFAFINMEVPCFNEVIEISKAVGRLLPLGYIGIDVAVDVNTGPLVIEVNVRPGLEIQNVCGIGLRELLLRSSAGELI